MGLIAHALWKGGLSDHTSLHHLSLHVPVGLLHSQQMFNFVPISITDQPKKRSLLKMKSQSREKRSNYSSLERHVALFGHQGAWRGCKCRRGLKCVGCSSVQWIIHQGTWLVNLKTVLRGQILLPVKHSLVTVMLIGTMEELLFPLQPLPCIGSTFTLRMHHTSLALCDFTVKAGNAL